VSRQFISVDCERDHPVNFSNTNKAAALTFLVICSLMLSLVTSTSANAITASVAVAPGILALDGQSGSSASVSPVCTSTSYCIQISTSNNQLAVSQEIGGVWQSAQRIPGLSNLVPGYANSGTYVRPSCWSDGNCGVVGYVQQTSGYQELPISFNISNAVVSTPTLIDLSALPAFTSPYLSAISCVSAQYCQAVGQVNDNGYVGFEIQYVNGLWGSAASLPGLAALSFSPTTNNDNFTGLQCPSVGNCTALGEDFTSSGVPSIGQFGEFLISEVNGVWNQPQPIDLSQSGVTLATVGTDSGLGQHLLYCESLGNCVAFLNAYGASGNAAGFMREVGGVWGTAQWITSATLNLPSSPNTSLDTFSCLSVNYCMVVTSTFVQSSLTTEFVPIVNGTVGTPSAISSVHSQSGNIADDLSCAATNECEAFVIEDISQAHNYSQLSSEIASYDNGVVTSNDVPGLSSLDVGQNSYEYGTCTSLTNCVITGVYTDASSQTHLFVGSVTPSFNAPVVPSAPYFTKPASPSAVTAVMNNGVATVSFKESNLGNLPSFYQIEMFANGTDEGNVCNLSVLTSCTVSNLSPGIQYSFVATATNSLGSASSNPSSEVSYAAPTTTTTVVTTTTTTTVVRSSKTITCVKGKKSKKVTGANPVCPTGYAKK